MGDAQNTRGSDTGRTPGQRLAALQGRVSWKRRRQVALDYLKTIYRYNEQTGSFIIDVRLLDYSQAFSQWDSAWAEVREVAHGLVQYLKECSDDIPFRSPIEIVFSVTEPRDHDTEERIIHGVHSYFRVRCSDVLLAVGGEYGTLSEMAIALKEGKHVIALQSRYQLDGVIVAVDPRNAVELALQKVIG
ncbi:MAG: hypothetical protein R6V29_00645 [Spirochaetia bacterium]